MRMNRFSDDDWRVIGTEEIINPLISDGKIFRDGSAKLPTAVFRLK